MAWMLRCSLIIILLLDSALAFSASDSSSPWSSASWKLTLNVGREPGSEGKWGASGGRLVLPINIMIKSDISPERDATGGSAYLLCPEGESSFINSNGLQTVEFGTGGWKLELPPGGGKGLATKLRMWLDVKTEATRNDVTLKAGERIYLEAICWREEDLERGNRAIQPFIAAYEQAQQRLEAQVAHDTGDRRLDGNDPLATLAAYKDMVELVAYRDEKLRLLQKAELVYPRNPNEIPEGPWPGAIEWLAIAPTRMSVKRRKSFLDEYHEVGTWEATPILKEDEYEEVKQETRFENGKESLY